MDTSAYLVGCNSFGDNFRTLKQHFTERPPKVQFVYVIHTYARYLSSKTAGFPRRKEFYLCAVGFFRSAAKLLKRCVASVFAIFVMTSPNYELLGRAETGNNNDFQLKPISLLLEFKVTKIYHIHQRQRKHRTKLVECHSSCLPFFLPGFSHKLRKPKMPQKFQNSWERILGPE